MRTLTLLAASILPLSATPENPLIPDAWFQEITATDGSTQQCVIFTTVPGVEYTFYHSHGLESWTEIGRTYGLGHQFSAAMRETAPAPPPPDPQNPPPPGSVSLPASITIKPSSGTAGGTVVSWPSVDHGNAVQYLITGTMATAWSSVPLFAETYGTHQFFISHTPGNTAPPAANPVLETKDAAMIADLEAAWSAFNTSVTTAQQTAINTPPPPPAPDAKGFWRIKADWSLDSDGDGSPDHLEFANAVAGPNGLVGNAFNADTDGDGQPDGKQLDGDGDGIPDAQDALKNNPDIAFRNVSLPRYAMFEIPGRALQVSDRGTVLFPWRIWKNGSVIDVPAGHTARGINDNDEILGTAARYGVEETGGPLDGKIFIMPSPSGGPQYFSFTAPKTDLQGNPIQGEATVFAYDKHDTETTYGPAPVLSAAGDFIAFGQVADGEPGENELVAGSSFYMAAHWQKGGNPERTGVDNLTDYFFSGLGINHPEPPANQQPVPVSYSWGWDFEEPEGERAFVTSDTGALTGLPNVPLNIIKQTVNRQSGAVPSYIATFPDDGNGTPVSRAKIHIDGSWNDLGELGSAIDFSLDGSAVGYNLPGAKLPVLLNGKWTAMARYAPGAPEAWLSDLDARLTDTTPGGWALAVSGYAQAKSAALLPIRVKGRYTLSNGVDSESAAGVDDFSITSSDPAESPDGTDHVKDRIWIMAPLGGPAKTVTIKAPVHSTAPVRMGADGILLGGAAEANLTGFEITVSAVVSQNEGEGAQSGDEKLLDIKMGAVDSVTKPIGLKVMKERVIKVVVWKVASDRNPEGVAQGDPAYQAPIEPVFTKTEAELNNYLNDIYKPQVNARFECEYRDIAIRFDTSDGTPYGAPANKLNPANGSLDIIGGLDNEFNAIREEAYDDTRSINVYLVAASGNITTYKWIEQLDFLKSSSYRGYADPERRLVAVACGFGSDPLVIMDTTAHEIGHLLLGEGHPDTNGGPAPLPDTRHMERLMCSGPKRPKDGSAKLLVKGEWDKAELWLKKEIDGEEL